MANTQSSTRIFLFLSMILVHSSSEPTSLDNVDSIPIDLDLSTNDDIVGFTKRTMQREYGVTARGFVPSDGYRLHRVLDGDLVLESLDIYKYDTSKAKVVELTVNDRTCVIISYTWDSSNGILLEKVGNAYKKLSFYNFLNDYELKNVKETILNIENVQENADFKSSEFGKGTKYTLIDSRKKKIHTIIHGSDAVVDNNRAFIINVYYYLYGALEILYIVYVKEHGDELLGAFFIKEDTWLSLPHDLAAEYLNYIRCDIKKESEDGFIVPSSIIPLVLIVINLII